MRCSSVIRRDQKPDNACFSGSGLPIPANGSLCVSQISLLMRSTIRLSCFCQGNEGQIPISYLPPMRSKQLRPRLVKPRSSTQAHPQRIDHISATRAYAIAIKEIAAYARVHWAIALFHTEPSQKLAVTRGTGSKQRPVQSDRCAALQASSSDGRSP